MHFLRNTLHCVAALVLAGSPAASARRLLNASTSNPASISGVQDIDIGVGCGKTTYPADDIVENGGLIGPTFTYVVSNPLATFLSVRFAQFNLPANDFVIIRPTHFNANETHSFTYRCDGTHVAPFFSDELFTQSITIELYTLSGGANAADPKRCTGFRIDNYRYLAVAANAVGSSKEEVCGSDDSREASCFKMFPEVFQQSTPVMRLLTHKTGGSFFCTGWLLGCEGHVITNHHCIASQDQAKDTKFEFQALGDSCGSDCDQPFACKGKVRGSSAQLLFANPDLDYALVKLDENLSGDYGYLRMRESGAVVGERVYLPQHPAGWGKRIAMKTDDDWGKIESLTQGGCLPNQVSYSLDTQGGSSGSPLLAYSDHIVVGLHHCGGCPNTAVNARDIVADLKAKGLLPQCALA